MAVSKSSNGRQARPRGQITTPRLDGTDNMAWTVHFFVQAVVGAGLFIRFHSWV